MNKIDLSVIITAYQEPIDKIQRAIISVKKCNVNEILLISDFSSMENTKMYQSLSDKYHISYFPSKEKHGVSFSRNCGIEIAKSKYIAFLDGDDLLEPEFMNIITLFDKEDCDFVLFNIKTNYLEKTEIHKSSCEPNHLYSSKDNKWESVFNESYIVFNDKHIFNRKFLIDNKIRFSCDHYKGEDSLFMANCLKYFSSFLYLDIVFQQYFIDFKNYSLKDAIDELISINECRLLFSDKTIRHYYEKIIIELFKSRVIGLNKQHYNVKEYFKILKSFKVSYTNLKDKLIYLLFDFNLNKLYFLYLKIRFKKH